MKFTCQKSQLQSAVVTTSRAVATKSPIPALEGILVETGEGSITLTGYDLKTGISTTLEATVQQPGRMVLSARLFSEIVRKLPEDTISFSAKDYTVTISSGMSEFNILGTAAEDFAALPEVNEEMCFTLEQKDLRDVISQTLFAVSVNENRPVYKGGLLDIKDNQLTLVCLDGYRLALRRCPIVGRNGSEVFSFIVPGAALSEIEKICGEEDQVRILHGAKHVLFEIGSSRVITRCIEGEFMDYNQAVPRGNSILLNADAKSLLQCIDRVSLIITEKQKSPLRCCFDEHVLRVSTKTAVGDASDEYALDGDGTGLEIGFNNKYLMDALKNCPKDAIKIELNTNVSPMIIVPQEGEEDFIYMILPVRLGANS